MTKTEVPEYLIDLLGKAKRVSVLTGSGISAESGVPTFRGSDGLWNKFRPEELASVDAFLRNPELVWEWYDYRRRLVKEVKPNPGHYTLAEMENHYAHFSLCTQNVDGLHERAGSRRVHELHGNILKSKCSDCHNPVKNVTFQKGQPVPRCSCGGMVRPDVVWFGEMLPQDVLEQSIQEASHAEIYLTVGTSALVYPAASLPYTAKACGAIVIEINPEETPFTHTADYSFRAKAGEFLPHLWQLVKSNK